MKTQREPDDYEKEEADHAAANISKILSLVLWISPLQDMSPYIEESLRVCFVASW